MWGLTELLSYQARGISLQLTAPTPHTKPQREAGLMERSAAG